MSVSTLDQRATEVLQAIQSLGSGWHDRNTIAHALGKDRLRGEEILVLDYLIKENRIEQKAEAIPDTIVTKWLYRIKQD